MSRPWYAHFPADYADKTAHLTMLEHGAYRLLLDYYYSTAHPLQANAKLLYRICRAFAGDEQAAIDKILEEFFVLQPDGYHNQRADIELKKADELSEIRRNAGKIGGKSASVRKSKSKANALPNALQLQTPLTSHSLDKSSLRSDLSCAQNPRKSRNRSIPEDCPTDEDFRWATETWLKKGRNDLVNLIDEHAAQFRDYHSAKGSTMKDWSAAWRTWARNALKFNGLANSNGKPSDKLTVFNMPILDITAENP